MLSLGWIFFMIHRVLLEDFPGLQEPVAEDVEVRRQFSEVLFLAPGMEDGDLRLAAEIQDRVVDVPLEDVEAFVGLHHALRELLRRRYHPVADAAYVHPLLLAELLVDEELAPYLDAASFMQLEQCKFSEWSRHIV